MKLTGIGFIGSGFARRVQAPAFQSTEKVKLVACASPHNAEAFAAEFNMPHHYNDWREMLKNPDIELVCITSPPYLHFEQAMECMKAGKHVLCEKPFTLNTEEAKTLWEHSKTSGKLCLLDHELRFTPPVRYIKSKLERYYLGEIFYASAMSELTFRNNPAHPFNWWSEKEKGGGSWGAIGSHLIDLLRYLVDEISAAETTLTTGYKKRKDKKGEYQEVTSDDIAASVLRFRSGAGGSVFTSTASFETRFDIVITGEKGSLKLDIDGEVTHVAADGTSSIVEIPLTENDEQILKRYHRSQVPPNKFSKAFFFYADAIVKAIQSEEQKIPCAATFEDGYLTQQVLASGWEV